MGVSWGPTNPWGGTIDDRHPDTDLAELLPGGSLRDPWLESVQRIAAALEELREAGVVVLWRPMQEMNGEVYWWAKGRGNLNDSHHDYVLLWRDLFEYFAGQELDNLLWVFSPMVTRAWSSFPYPGDDYVDIVAGTSYSDDLSIPGYEDFLVYGKPVAMAEYGWGFDRADGSHDNRLYVETLQRYYSRVAYFAAWNSWPGFDMAIVDNLHASELMNDVRVITRDEIRW